MLQTLLVLQEAVSERRLNKVGHDFIIMPCFIIRAVNLIGKVLVLQVRSCAFESHTVHQFMEKLNYEISGINRSDR